MSTTEGIDWHPAEKHGWFRCLVRVWFENHYTECYTDITVDLWYNAASLRHPWFAGTPGKCAPISIALPSSQVLGLAS